MGRQHQNRQNQIPPRPWQLRRTMDSCVCVLLAGKFINLTMSRESSEQGSSRRLQKQLGLTGPTPLGPPKTGRAFTFSNLHAHTKKSGHPYKRPWILQVSGLDTVCGYRDSGGDCMRHSLDTILRTLVDPILNELS